MKIRYIGSAPFPLRLLIWLAVLVLVGALVYYFALQGASEELDQKQKEEVSLKAEVTDKQARAASLSALKEQQTEIEESISQLLRQLPDETEVPGLLVDISQEGLGAGLEIELLELQAERTTEYYVELPINIKVVGDYNKFGNFVDGVARLPRIVTIQDIKVDKRERGRNDSSTELVMQAVAKTYRSLPTE